MKRVKIVMTSKNGALRDRPPRAVNVRSAEGYVGRLVGVERHAAPEVTDTQINKIVRELERAAD
jgi:hypothetical protein